MEIIDTVARWIAIGIYAVMLYGLIGAFIYWAITDTVRSVRASRAENRKALAEGRRVQMYNPKRRSRVSDWD